MKAATALAFISLTLFYVPAAYADTFGNGVNTFDIEFASVGNPGNLPDATGSPNPAGSVAYTYRMGKFEISEQMIDKANALGGLGITKTTRGPDKPATSVSWNEAARFVNWLNTSTGSTPAYKFAVQPGEAGYSANADIELWTISDTGYDPNNLYRNSVARYFLPSVHEWYKAAYYDPASSTYYDYPTGSNAAPTPVASGTAAGTAVYGQSSATEPANITLAGGLSPYGTMGQGGNVHEWEETDSDLVNGPSPSSTIRGLRGGNRTNSAAALSSLLRFGGTPGQEGPDVGFRVASILSPPGDYNADGSVNAADYSAGRKGLLPFDYGMWRTHFGESQGIGGGGSSPVPEPTAVLLLAIAISAATLVHRIDRKRCL